ncbi:hypothetical protein CI105_03645 [Candidatus Izimaplasma bacterium ZiA1]|uniref:GNAT family N-acetyltransferase n=1 Tax=Candidatus Izimoplasma sp. ZiA1 TaxID=2024899 RepID=UPI000BAA8167|nr:hypothetical protein CI105_03645 [Candidatus Izimaplasma bacterium ZiA1]
MTDIIKTGNMFHIDSNDKTVAKITYFFEKDDVIVIDHTIVSPELRGQSIAKKLLNTVVEFARENNFKIIPVCSYAVAKLENNDEYSDILYQN